MMSDETRRVLDLLAQGKVTVEEAEALLAALKERAARDEADPAPGATESAKRRFLRINVHKTSRDGGRDKDVNIRVPIGIVRGGMRLGALIPGFGDRVTARLRGSGVNIDLTKMDAATLESLLKDLGQVNIDVNEGEEQVRITCE
jgi:hypothetical protein